MGSFCSCVECVGDFPEPTAAEWKRAKFLEWASMQGGPKDLQMLLDNYDRTGEYPEAFELYMSDYEVFEKNGSLARTGILVVEKKVRRQPCKVPPLSSNPCEREYCQMATSLRVNWDLVNDCPKVGPRRSLAEEARAYQQAISQSIPEYRAKLVRLPHGQTEISITPANSTSVINARMGFNPLLDCPRKRRTVEEQEERDIENRERAAKRARQNVRHLVKSIFADHMLTFSYRENVLDRARVASDWKEFVRLFRIRYSDWQYLAVLEKQERGSFHIHVAVVGKQDIRWLLRCWLLAIGQPPEDLSAWLVGGLKLGEKSLGAVNATAPNRRWGGTSRKWKREKLAGYLTKYIGKEFEEADKNAKKYWHSRNIVRPTIERFWLRAKTYEDAVREAFDYVFWSGATNYSMWGDDRAGVIFIQGETRRELIGKITQGVVELLDD